MGNPLCCGEPMVRNTWACRWECADAYFRLFDEGWDGGDPRDPDDLDVEVPVKATILQLVTADDLRAKHADHLVPYLEHWLASFRPDNFAEILHG